MIIDIVTLSGMIDNVEGGLNTVSGNLNTLTLIVGNQLTYIQSLSGLVKTYKKLTRYTNSQWTY